MRSRLLVPRRRVFGASGFTHVLVQAIEQRTRYAHLGYQWRVRLESHNEDTVLDVSPLVFIPHQQRERPIDPDPLPPRVDILVNWLRERDVANDRV